ncbi:MAG TPA: hypothetical protein PK604_09645 [Acetivibrio clariflavus]|mgnify:FL=1|nr:hypothetical protein [Acetivibrio clariflavus]
MEKSVLLIMQLKLYILGKLTLTEEQLNNTDLNDGGKVVTIDNVLLKAYLLGIIKAI